MSSKRVRVAVGRVAAASRKAGDVPDGVLEEARQELLSARLEEAVDNALEPDPPYTPLSQEERQRLAGKLLGDDRTDSLEKLERAEAEMTRLEKLVDDAERERDQLARELETARNQPKPQRRGGQRGRPTGPGQR